MVQHHWLRRGNWTPDNWALNLSVFKDGRVVGLQTLAARDFAVLRQVSTASWLGLHHQRQGLGTEMRAAVLHLAFSGLGAVDALSGAFEDNPSSFSVSEKLGYELDGLEQLNVRERRATMRRLRLPRARWERQQRISVTIVGLTPCLQLFGLPGEAAF